MSKTLKRIITGAVGLELQIYYCLIYIPLNQYTYICQSNIKTFQVQWDLQWSWIPQHLQGDKIQQTQGNADNPKIENQKIDVQKKVKYGHI